MARGRKSSLVVLLTPAQRSDLEALQRRTTISAGLARRARLVLLRAAGAPRGALGRVAPTRGREVDQALPPAGAPRPWRESAPGASPGLFPPRSLSIWSIWPVSGPNSVGGASPTGIAPKRRVRS